jgi:hypothetical protein
MTNKNLFPAGIALDEAFCNRTQERILLRQSIISNQSIVLISPRRYGKTSLIFQVLHENQFPYCMVDFLPATHLNFVRSAILGSVSALLTQLLPLHKKLKQKLLDYFIHLNPKIVLSAAGQQVELSPQQSSPKTIMEALLALDDLAKAIKRRVIVVFDEFQQVGTLSENQEIEASLRHAVERSQQVSYIFSGSNRHLLAQMFNDRKRPFYHLCDLMKLERISSEDYTKFIQIAAKKRWKKLLMPNVTQEILDLTKCHTYYVNALCRQLWKLPEAPTRLQVTKKWQEAVQEQYPWITEDIGNLSVNQRLVLAALAHEPTREPQGQTFCKKVGLIPANIKRALDTLLENDFVFRDKNNFYQALDPAVLTYLRSIAYFGFDKG